MRVLLLNQDWFADELRSYGHEILTLGISPHLDIVLEQPLQHIDTVLAEQANNWRPDVIVWLDNSAPIAVQGLEETEIPCLFYSVDAQHHIDVHKNIAHIFDHTLVAQPDYIAQFAEQGVQAEWFPLWAPRHVEAVADKDISVSFVGNMNPSLNPKRVKFFDELQKLVPIHITQGAYWEIFPRSEIVINQAVKGDVNFRTFEAMMCGTLLLTENIGNGLKELFQDGEHLRLYEPENPAHAAELIKELLSSRETCRQIARQGREEILAKHTASHRAALLNERIIGTRRTSSSHRFLAALLNYTVISVLLSKHSTLLQTKALLAALKSAEIALQRGEKPNQYQSFQLVTAALTYDQVARSSSGTRVLFQYHEAFPDNQVFSCAALRQLLNAGQFDEAIQIAQHLSDADPKEIFRHADTVVTEILALTRDEISF